MANKDLEKFIETIKETYTVDQLLEIKSIAQQILVGESSITPESCIKAWNEAIEQYSRVTRVANKN